MARVNVADILAGLMSGYAGYRGQQRVNADRAYERKLLEEDRKYRRDRDTQGDALLREQRELGYAGAMASADPENRLEYLRRARQPTPQPVFSTAPPRLLPEPGPRGMPTLLPEPTYATGPIRPTEENRYAGIIPGRSPEQLDEDRALRAERGRLALQAERDRAADVRSRRQTMSSFLGRLISSGSTAANARLSAALRYYQTKLTNTDEDEAKIRAEAAQVGGLAPGEFDPEGLFQRYAPQLGFSPYDYGLPAGMPDLLPRGGAARPAVGEAPFSVTVPVTDREVPPPRFLPAPLSASPSPPLGFPEPEPEPEPLSILPLPAPVATPPVSILPEPAPRGPRTAGQLRAERADQQNAESRSRITLNEKRGAVVDLGRDLKTLKLDLDIPQKEAGLLDARIARLKAMPDEAKANRVANNTRALLRLMAQYDAPLATWNTYAKRMGVEPFTALPRIQGRPEPISALREQINRRMNISALRDLDPDIQQSVLRYFQGTGPAPAEVRRAPKPDTSAVKRQTPGTPEYAARSLEELRRALLAADKLLSETNSTLAMPADAFPEQNPSSKLYAREWYESEQRRLNRLVKQLKEQISAAEARLAPRPFVGPPAPSILPRRPAAKPAAPAGTRSLQERRQVVVERFRRTIRREPTAAELRTIDRYLESGDL